MPALQRRDLLCIGAASAATAAMPGLALAKDQSTLSGAGQRSIERYLTLQEGALQRTRQAGAIGSPDWKPRFAVNLTDRILLWHEVSLDTNALDYVPVPNGQYHQQFGPCRSSRAMAVVQLTVFEVVNAKFPLYQSYIGFHAPQGDWSVDAAVAQASYQAQLYLYPPQAQRLNAILLADLANIGGDPRAIQAGVAVGTSAFVALLAALGNDNTTLPDPSIPSQYMPSGLIGVWNVDPVSQLMVALGANWPLVKPFTFVNQAAFRAPPPPSITSPEFLAQFKAVEAIGGDPMMGTPTTRTDRETFIGKFWSYDGTPGLCAPPRLYNMIARQLVMARGVLAPAPIARFLALLNVAMADAGVSAWEAKYYYKYWRPITGIRWPGIAGGNPSWYPLGGQATNTTGPNFTPPFPSYPSGHATFGGAVFEVLRAYMPDSTRFTFVSDEFNGLNRDVYGYIRPRTPATFDSLTDAETSNAESRVFIGVHWQFDANQGILQGRRVAQQVLSTFALPRDDARRG
jgi:hypothetical protein